MGLFDLVTPQQPTQQPAQTQATPGNIPEAPATAPQQTAVTDPNGLVPAQPAATVEPVASDSPIDQFKDIWEPVSSENNKATPAQLDPAKLKEVIAKADFSNTIPADTLAAISAGGEDAQAAFQTAMNSVAQNVMMQSTLASNKMIEQAVASAVKAQNEKIPGMLREQSLSNNLKDSNPVFSNPAVKPVIEAVQSQLASKNPNATTAELTEMAQNFVAVLGESLAPKPTAANPEGDNTVDWEAYLNGA